MRRQSGVEKTDKRADFSVSHVNYFKVCQRCLRKDILFTENFLYDELFFFSFLFIGRFLCHIVYKSYV